MAYQHSMAIALGDLGQGGRSGGARQARRPAREARWGSRARPYPRWVHRNCRQAARGKRRAAHGDLMSLWIAHRSGALRDQDRLVRYAVRLSYRAMRRGRCQKAELYAALAEDIAANIRAA